MSNAEQDVADAIEWGILVRNWEVLTRVPLHDATEVSLEIIARTAQKDVPRLIAEVERLRSVAALVSILKKDVGAILADNERLRAVEQAARKLYEYEETHDRPLLRHAYMWADLAAALDANKQEPGT